MAQTRKELWWLGGYLFGTMLLVAAAARIVVHFIDQANLVPALALLVVFSCLYLLEPWLSPRLRWPWHVYFPIQIGLVFILGNLRPFLDSTPILYILLSSQAALNLSRRAAVLWIIVMILLLVGIEINGIGWLPGLVISMLMIAVAIFLTSYNVLYARTQADQEKSQLLLADLQAAHQKLQDYAAQAQELAATRERNRLARELHDTVSQVIFSITLTARSAQMLLEQDPAGVPAQLERLQEMTASALAQLRSLITQMRPPQKS